MDFEQEYLIKIVRYFNEPNNVLLQQEVETIKNSSQQHLNFYNDVEKIWLASSELRDFEKINVIEATERLSEKLRQSSRFTESKTVSLWGWFLRAAAVFVVGLSSWFVYNEFFNVTYFTLETSNAADSILLSDGSKIFLDQSTILKYPQEFKGSERKVFLVKGNAYFDIAPDKSHPFIVELYKSSVRVVGTGFNISTSTDDIQVSVKEGTVVFKPSFGDKQTTLTAGKGVSFNIRSGAVTPVDVSNKNADAWHTGKLSFTDASLAEVLVTLENFYKVDIQLEDSIANFKKFNATFRNNQLHEVLEVLQATYPIDVQKKDSVLIIRSSR